MQSLEEKSQEVARVLKNIDHPKRLLVLCCLYDGKKTVNEIEKACQISQSQLSQFLAQMRDEGILASEKVGKYVFYTIADNRIRELVKSLKNIFCQ